MFSKRFFLCLCAAFLSVSAILSAAPPTNPQLQSQLANTYHNWRSALLAKDARGWGATTAQHRQLAIRNRLYSERREFPKAVFELPLAPPSIDKLTCLQAQQKGATATAVYFGQIDFGLDGPVTENLLLLHFLHESGSWKYDTADFINLMALPEIRKQLKNGDFSYIEQKDFQPSGKSPAMPPAVAPAKYIAKVYVFCPGRDVKVKVNKISDHHFTDTKAAEVVIGGGIDGLNEVQFATKPLEGSTGKEALSIRVYLMSTVAGTPPLKVYEYQINEGESAKPFGSSHFLIDSKMRRYANK